MTVALLLLLFYVAMFEPRLNGRLESRHVVGIFAVWALVVVGLAFAAVVSSEGWPW